MNNFDSYPYYEWQGPLSKWEDDEFEDRRHGTIKSRERKANNDSCGFQSWSPKENDSGLRM